MRIFIIAIITLLLGVSVIGLFIIHSSNPQFPSAEELRLQDEKTVRRQFNLPESVGFSHFAAMPDTIVTWFGRESLSISAVAQFTTDEFDSYIKTLDD